MAFAQSLTVSNNTIQTVTSDEGLKYNIHHSEVILLTWFYKVA